MFNFQPFLEQINEYRKQKGKDLLTPDDFAPDPVASLISDLDLLIREEIVLVESVLFGKSTQVEEDRNKIDLLQEQIKDIKESIIEHPDSTWTKQLLEHRIRQVHYK
jgi:hypothetical protein